MILSCPPLGFFSGFQMSIPFVSFALPSVTGMWAVGTGLSLLHTT